MVKQALFSQIEQIVLLDESVIGSRKREGMISEAVDKGHCQVIDLDGRIVAYAIVQDNFFGNHFIELLIVDCEYRRRGIGKELLKAIKETCRTDKLFTSTNNSNIPMQKLLEASGFKRCGWVDCLDEGDPEVFFCLEKAAEARIQENRMMSEIGDFIKAYALENDFSGAIHFSKRGGDVFEEAFGYANRDWNIPNNTQTRFNTASISKVFTACGIVKLAEAGLLKIEDKLCDILDFDNSPFSNEISICHLLTHSSGIADDADEEAGEDYSDIFTTKPNYRFRKAADLIENFIDKSPVFKPGCGCRYNNAGYVLLGLIIEKVTGMEYKQWVTKNILIPWGMINTFFLSMDEVNSNTAEGYFMEMADGKTMWRKNIYSIPPVGTPEGGIYSTVGDLNRLMRGLAEGKFFKPEYSRLILSPKVMHSGDENIQHRMGFGFEFKTEGDRIRYMKKDGSNPGVSAVMVYYPYSGTSLVLLSNSESDVWDLHRKIDELFSLNRTEGDDNESWITTG